MNGNPTEAEDALSTAMLKAKEKMAQWVGAIDNVRGWLTQLTRNLCIDIHRKRRTQAVESLENIENIEVLGESGELVSQSETPEGALETEEEKIVVRRAIARLPKRLRDTFILHFDRQLSYQEIADQQNISYANVRKRISQARGVLKQILREYFVLSPQPPFGRGAKEECAKNDVIPAFAGIHVCDVITCFKNIEAETVLSPQPPLGRGAKEECTKNDVIPAFAGIHVCDVITCFKNIEAETVLSPQPPLGRGAKEVLSQPPLERGAKEVLSPQPMAFERGAKAEWAKNDVIPAFAGTHVRDVIPAKAGIHSDRPTLATPVLIPEMPELFQRYWRVWMDSGGCQSEIPMKNSRGNSPAILDIAALAAQSLLPNFPPGLFSHRPLPPTSKVQQKLFLWLPPFMSPPFMSLPFMSLPFMSLPFMSPPFMSLPFMSPPFQRGG